MPCSRRMYTPISLCRICDFIQIKIPMPQRSNAFQQLITLLHQQLDDRAVVTESKMLRDQRTGDNREVDIVIDARSGGYPITIGVECIDHKRKASVEWVERMWAKHQDLHTDKIVLVSRSGF